MSNTRPIKATTKINFVNHRGRVYECLRCGGDKYRGERSKVITHIFRKHVALDSVPFYCSICKFVTTSQLDLEKHVDPKVYPTHKATVEAMLTSGDEVNEEVSLLQNLKHYVPDENDMRRLSKEDSNNIFAARSRKATQDDILHQSMLVSGLPTQKALSQISGNTENIMEDLLDGHQPTPFSLSPVRTQMNIQSQKTIRVNKTTLDKSTDNNNNNQVDYINQTDKNKDDNNNNDDSSSTSSSSSSSSSSDRNYNKLLSEVSTLRTEVKKMGKSLGELVCEMNKLMDIMMAQQQQKQQQERNKENRNREERRHRDSNRHETRGDEGQRFRPYHYNHGYRF